MDESALKKRLEQYSKGKWLLFDEMDVGMTFPRVEFEVTRELVEKYTAAMGDDNPIFHDAATAGKAGFESPIAPPTIV